MHHPYPVIEPAGVTLLCNLCIEPLIEFRSRGKGAKKRCSRTHHVPLCEIQKLLPDKLVVHSLFFTQRMLILNVAPAVTASLLAILPLIKVDDLDNLVAIRLRERIWCDGTLCTVVFHSFGFLSVISSYISCKLSILMDLCCDIQLASAAIFFDFNSVLPEPVGYQVPMAELLGPLIADQGDFCTAGEPRQLIVD